MNNDNKNELKSSISLATINPDGIKGPFVRPINETLIQKNNFEIVNTGIKKKKFTSRFKIKFARKNLIGSILYAK